MTTALLEGVRVVDLSWVGAGPYGSQLLAFLGADVLKVESADRPDLFRRSTRPGAEGPDQSSRFNCVNLGKKSVQLNLATDVGRQILLDLVARSDVVVENFRPGVLDRLGIGYEALAAANPAVILASLSAAGQTGPDAQTPGYASVFNAMGGLGAETGYPDGPPVEVRDSVDFRTGAALALGVVMSLVRRQRTGLGEWVDVSAREAIASLIGESFLELAITGTSLGRNANARDGFAPHDVYPAEGDDRWIAIAVGDDDAWTALCGAIGQPGFAKDERFRTAQARHQNRAALDAIVSGWTSVRDPRMAAAELTAAGVAASEANRAADLIQDRGVRSRGMLQQIDHPTLGPQWIAAAPWSVDGEPPQVVRSPLLGEHTRGVLSEILDLTAAELDELEASGVLR
jgi:crotonobetainyl-CoA:carnitine CoA-transferase CaiB-like acyl-CoA transferase